MARPRSDQKRNSIIAAAIRVVAVDGTGASTAIIAHEAGVSNGSLFTYFETKADLLNQLYTELKADIASAALAAVPAGSDRRTQLSRLWSHWLHWAASSPEKRRALAHLEVSDEITAASREASRQSMAPLAAILDRSRMDGPMRDVSLEFVLSVAGAIADATTDFMIQNPARADAHCSIAFDALWRILN